MLHHIAKAPAEGDVEDTGTKASFQAARDMKIFGKENGPGVGRPPQDRLIIAVPGKDAVAIGFEQPLWAQVAPNGEQAFGRRQINRRET